MRGFEKTNFQPFRVWKVVGNDLPIGIPPVAGGLLSSSLRSGHDLGSGCLSLFDCDLNHPENLLAPCNPLEVPLVCRFFF